VTQNNPGRGHDSSSRSSNAVEQANCRRPAWRTSGVFQVDGSCSQEPGHDAHRHPGPDGSRQSPHIACQRYQQKAITIATRQIHSLKPGERLGKDQSPGSIPRVSRQRQAISCAVLDRCVITFRSHGKVVYTAESLKSLGAKENASRMDADTTRPMRRVHATSVPIYTSRRYRDTCLRDEGQRIGEPPSSRGIALGHE